MVTKFELKGEYIELIKLLKTTGIAENGGHAQALVEENKVTLNRETETRKRAKIKIGDIIEVFGETFEVV